MSARLVGWMPHIGRLTAAVGASARLGATADNDVVVRVDGVSRSHALLVEQPDGYYIEDKGSSNGTWVNGERVKRARLRHLDVITLGRFAELVFVARETDVAAKGAPFPAPAAAMTAQLQWLDGPLAGQTINLPHGEIVIGRAETCGLVVDSDAVSRMHARMTISDEGVTIEDLGTVNGTTVNGEALAAATPLESGAEVDIGQVRRFKLIVNRGAAASVPVVEEPDDVGSTRLVWSPKDLEMLEKARATRKSGTRPAVKPAAAAPLPLSGSKKAAAPAASPPPAPLQVAPPVAPEVPAAPAAMAPAAGQGGGESGAAPRTAIVGANHTVLAPPTLGAPPSAVQPLAGATEDDGKTRYDPAASVKLPHQFQDDAPTSLGQGAPDDLPTSLGERGPEEQRTAVTPMTSLDPPTALERAAAGADDQTALPFATAIAAGVRTELGGSPFDLPADAGGPNVLSPEDLPTSLGGAPDSPDPATYMPSNAFNPRDRTNLPPDTVLGFRDVGPSARGPGSSGATYLSPGEPEKLPSAIQPPAAVPAQDSLSTIESIKLTGDLGAYVIQRGTATVGRSGDATIRIDSREMSRIHAILSVTDREVIVEDRGSINGTSVNGTAISGRRTLVHGDRVCFADFEFRLEVKRTEGHP
jgi:pSer/pThr/pTyr-binding forkhead associated (FHA) protein